MADQARTSEPGTLAGLRGALARMPLQAWVVLGLFLIAALLMALHGAFAKPKDSALRLKVQHSFRNAQVLLFVDGDQVYSGKLSSGIKKRFGLIPESVQGSLSTVLAVSSGTHDLRVRIQSDDGSFLESTTSSEFIRGRQQTLDVVARHDHLYLDWQGGSMSGNSAGWWQRYAGSLFITLAGSIVSAITGFAIRELPRKIAARRSRTSKAESAGVGS